ncbi:MAG: nucleotidyltransferase family protein [Methanobacterium sp.]|nr:nucleotidyltransferase family protein [Methanobacterium sp.]
MKSEKVMRLFGENLEKITRYGVRRIGLFGSYIRDEQTENSDIDILVEFEKNKKTFDNYMELKFFLEDLFKCKIDLVVREAIKPSLKEYIMGSVKYAEGL